MDPRDLSRFGPYAAIHNADGTIVAISDELAELLGYTAAELVGKSGWELAPESNKARRERVHETLNVSGALHDVTVLAARDGTRIRFAYVAFVRADGLVISSGEPMPPDGFTLPADERQVTYRRLEQARTRSHDLARAMELAGTPGRWVDIRGAVDYTTLSESTIERAVDAGELPRGGTVGKRLFHTAWLDAWLLRRLGGGEVLIAVVVLLALVALACLCLELNACSSLHELGLRARHTHG